MRAAQTARTFLEEGPSCILEKTVSDETTIFTRPETSKEFLALPGVTASRVEGTRFVSNVVWSTAQ